MPQMQPRMQPMQFVPQQQGGGRGYNPPHQHGMFHPPGAGRGSRPVVVPPKEKKALTITDKDGNVIDLTSGNVVTPKASADNAAVEGITNKMSSLQVASNKSSSSDAGSSLRKAAEEAIKAGGAKKLKEQQEEEAAKKAVEEAKKAEEEAERMRVEKAKAEEEARKKEEAERLERERLVE
jgi:hypothetical protein